MRRLAGINTFVDWFQLGEFLRCSWRPISDSGRPLPFVGEAVGVLLMRNGDTCRRCCQYGISATSRCRLTPSLRDILTAICYAIVLVLMMMQCGYVLACAGGMFAKNGPLPRGVMYSE
jgi:hypothetical protein